VSVSRRWAAAVIAAGLLVQSDAAAQGRAGTAPASARTAAPKDFTGYWVAVVTEHWHLRMMMPPKGEYAMLPLTPEGRKAADAWDPAKDKAEANECRAYGAAGLMRIPGRLHIHWADDNTLQIDTDSGTQTRLLRFGAAGATAPAGAAADWQGRSVAQWQGLGGRGGGRATGQLRVVTTNMRPGYLRKNGVPYSESARLEEFLETFTEPNGDSWLVVTSIVTDPRYLTQPYAATYPFKKIGERAGWDPTPCRVDEPR
jgi:hypothetical protein